MAALVFAVSLNPTTGFATVLEFNESGAMTIKPSLNYLQRQRRDSAVGSRAKSHQAKNFARHQIEHIVNNNQADGEIFADQDSALITPPAATPVAYESDSAMADIPAQAITFINVSKSEPSRGSSAQPAKRKPESSLWTDAALAAAETHHIPPRVFLALITAESDFKAKAVSPKGAIGLTQLMPGTAKALGVDPHDPHENLAGGARYLRQQYERFGSWSLALAAYNAGPTRVARLGRIPNIPETKAFVTRVMRDAGLKPSTITTASN